MRLFPLTPTIVFAVLLSVYDVQGGSSDHRYKQGEHVELWVNKVRWISYVAASTVPRVASGHFRAFSQVCVLTTSLSRSCPFIDNNAIDRLDPIRIHKRLTNITHCRTVLPKPSITLRIRKDAGMSGRCTRLGNI